MSVPTPFLYPLSVHPDVRAFSTTRHGGVGQGAYASFNVCHYTGDEPKHVAQNRDLLASALHIPATHIVLPRQTHTDNVRVIEKVPTSSHELDDVDALITSARGLCIGVSTADCIPILLYDSRLRIVAAIHAGWRGTVAHIVQKTLQTMQAHFGTQPSDIHAAIGPGICRKSYPVGEEVVKAFEQAGFDTSAIAEQTEGRWHLDLPLANRTALLDWGVSDQCIHDCGICTFVNHHDFFSARRQGIHSGRIYTGILMP